VKALRTSQPFQAIEQPFDIRLERIHRRHAIDQDVNARGPRQMQPARQTLHGTKPSHPVDQTRQVNGRAGLEPSEDAVQIGPQSGPGLQHFRLARVGFTPEFFQTDGLGGDFARQIRGRKILAAIRGRVRNPEDPGFGGPGIRRGR
jgi:hypothetical protein